MMNELLKSSAVAAYSQISLATLFNLGTIYYLKKADGFTHFWPSIAALVTISLTQWLLSRAMASGMDMGLAVTTLVVCVMIGSTLMGILSTARGSDARRWPCARRLRGCGRCPQPQVLYATCPKAAYASGSSFFFPIRLSRSSGLITLRIVLVATRV